MMMKKITAAAGMTALLLLSGCQAGAGNAENEALREQIAQLEQQINALEQQNNAVNNETAPAPEQPPVAPDNAQEQPPATDNITPQQPADNSALEQPALSTTLTMDELTSMVNAYIEKANATAPNGTASENMEQFFSLKQEEKQINDALDRHEDELETLYHQNALTRDEYKSMERELEKLEDSLDNAKDRLEYIFEIDD